MSLDVWLTVENVHLHSSSGIFIRENGSTKEISNEEWTKRYPDRKPITVIQDNETNEVYSGNITHNLGEMASHAGLYEYLWRPHENKITKARQLIKPLTRGLEVLKGDPEKFEKYNSENGWGTYEGLVAFVSNYLEACKKYPDSEIHIWK